MFARRFDASGAATSADFQVNSYTLDEQRLPSVALGDDGGYVVAWQSSQQDGFGFGIFAAVVPPLAALDVDGDGAVLPLTDGLLVLRDHFGFTGTHPGRPARPARAARAAPAARSRATSRRSAWQLDIDGNGALEP